VARADDPESLNELFAALGPVSVRRMFGGAGLYFEGVMFALVDDGVIYLKADGETAASFEREGVSQFSYLTKDGSRMLTSYWRLPDRLYDDPDELAEWARLAVAAAYRGRERPRRKGRK
jgi:DNA transformation protein